MNTPRRVHLLPGLLSLSSRLRDHIERMDQGVVAAVDDTAVVLRTLICDGKGGRLLERATKSLGASTPDIWIGPPLPRKLGNEVYLAFGALPLGQALANAVGGASIRVIDLRKQRVFSRKNEVWSWETFLRTYTNKWGGTHVDDEIPDFLAALEAHAPARMSLPAYAIRSAAVAVWEACQTVLQEVLKAPDDSVISMPGSVGSSPGPGPASQLLAMELTHQLATVTWAVPGAGDHDLGSLRFGGVNRAFSLSASDPAPPTPPAPTASLRLREPLFPKGDFSQGRTTGLAITCVDSRPGREGSLISGTLTISMNDS